MEDIWKLKFNNKKCKILQIGAQNIEDEYKLNNKEINKVNKECNLGVAFVDTFKADNHILSIVLRVNGMIGWIVRNFILREANVVLKIYETLIRSHTEYCTEAWAPAFIWFCWAGFHGISTFVDYLLSNLVYTYIKYIGFLNKWGVTFLNKSEFICLHTIKWFLYLTQIILFANNKLFTYS